MFLFEIKAWTASENLTGSRACATYRLDFRSSKKVTNIWIDAPSNPMIKRNCKEFLFHMLWRIAALREERAVSVHKSISEGEAEQNVSLDCGTLRKFLIRTLQFNVGNAARTLRDVNFGRP